MFKKVKELIRKKEILVNQINIELALIAKENCPYEIGDKILIDKGYSNIGKMGEITSIIPANPKGRHHKEHLYGVRGKVLRKDGSTGKVDFMFMAGDRKR